MPELLERGEVQMRPEDIEAHLVRLDSIVERHTHRAADEDVRDEVSGDVLSKHGSAKATVEVCVAIP